jgi:hypothetical protein
MDILDGQKIKLIKGYSRSKKETVRVGQTKEREGKRRKETKET